MRVTVAFSLSLFVAGCDGSIDNDPVTVPGKSVYTGAVTRLVLASHGGGHRPPTPGDARCEPGIGRYTLTMAGRHLAWDDCRYRGPGASPSYDGERGARSLTDREWRELVPTLRDLVVYEGPQCGADKDRLTLTVTTTTGELEYGDGFYACFIKDKPLITPAGLTLARGAFSELIGAGAEER